MWFDHYAIIIMVDEYVTVRFRGECELVLEHFTFENFDEYFGGTDGVGVGLGGDSNG